MLSGGAEIDLVGADAETVDPPQLGRRIQDPLGDLGARADPQVVQLADRLQQFILGQGAAVSLYPRVARFLQGIDGALVDALHESDADFMPGAREVHGCRGNRLLVCAGAVHGVRPLARGA